MILDAFRLDGKVAIVTGAVRGIDAEIARSFAEVGASLVCVVRTREELLRTCADAEAVGGRSIAVDRDLVASDAPDRIVDAALADFGRIDVVVNISSGFARAANIGSIPYGGAKAALEQLTRMLAMEYAPRIRVNGIRVGAVTTENMQQNLLAAMPGISEKLIAWTPLERHGTPADIAQAALFLASPASSFVTARTLAVDGGVVLERSAMELIARADRLAGS